MCLKSELDSCTALVPTQVLIGYNGLLYISTSMFNRNQRCVYVHVIVYNPYSLRITVFFTLLHVCIIHHDIHCESLYHSLYTMYISLLSYL